MKLHSTILGEGKPFVILHGFLGMSDNWKTVGKHLAEKGFEVHLVDQRNHGKSPHSVEFSYQLLAEDLVAYSQEHQLEKIILMGHSMGGKTAMLAACENEELIEKLIVVDIAPKYYAPHHQQILKGLTALDDAKLTSRGDAEDFLAEYIPQTGVRLFLLKNLYWKTKEQLSLKLNLDSLKENIENIGEALPEGNSYSGPALFIKGANSDYIEKTDELNIRTIFPKASFVTIKDAGHWVHAEKMEAFLATILQFV
ncbi:alpha/beta fold hydrolase [Christiangramia flava]|uniref:Putative esterase/lipase ybfF n=1 Tax=Christiangramia flava JLT2011 TaxID=1229726 RepID=A0A1L7I531_9FLAO|nr:alpha/beta fold hydrolase [Christiangramia flava]APU68729.1 Putative esterase/lipase ybfF [Christiangramia flava JLT2011]OSS39126.1 Esterase ybfF [Christiangramia flava JLT2011]